MQQVLSQLHSDCSKNISDSWLSKVTEWTVYFENKFHLKNIFQKFNCVHTGTSEKQALVVGTQWYYFSSFMPWFLCQAAAKVSDNEKRHYVIQTAFEELGMHNVSEIHAEMFMDCLSYVGIDKTKRDALNISVQLSKSLTLLSESLLATNSDDVIFGMLLGLEIPAKENIETIYQSLCYQKNFESILANHKFFQLHRKIEIEHVQLTVSNFLRFCKNNKQKNDFHKGFDVGVQFWHMFWEGISAQINN